MKTLYLALRRIGQLCSCNGQFPLIQSLLRRLFKPSHSEVEVHDFDGDLTMRLRLGEHMQRRTFWMGYYSREIIGLMKRRLSAGMVVLDIGANVGEITLIAAKAVGPTGKVFSFEPIAEIADRLEWHVRANHFRHVTVVREALAAKKADNVPIYRQPDSSRADDNGGLGSLYAATRNTSPTQFIRVNTLDAWLEEHPVDRIDLIKIDIEGAELPCLQGADRTLTRFDPAIIIEIQDHSAARAGYRQSDILVHLARLGYAFWKIERGSELTPLDITSLSEYQNVLCLPTRTPALHA